VYPSSDAHFFFFIFSVKYLSDGNEVHAINLFLSILPPDLNIYFDFKLFIYSLKDESPRIE
jgi:hypothetical protein